MKYYVAHNDNDVFHYGKIEEGQQVDSGQPYFEEFETEQELIDFLTNKSIDYETTIE
jgi:hypothetical protein